MAPRAAAAISSAYATSSSLLPRDIIFNGHNHTNFPNSVNDTTQFDIHRARLHTLHAKPFNHLSVWAYLALAFIILGMFTVIAYVVYTCYHSSRRRDVNGMRLDSEIMRGQIEDGMGRDDSFSHHWDYSVTSTTVSAPDTSSGGRMARGVGALVKIGEKGEKGGMDNSRGVIGGRKDLVEMRGISRGHKNVGSESEENIFSLPSNSISESMCNANDTSFETNTCNYLSSPPLAHITDKAAAYIPFHLPPPPPSPTPAYKEHLERQRARRPGGAAGQHSPVSPSPSCSFSPATGSRLPPITPRTASPLMLGDPDSTWSSAGTTPSPTDNLKSGPSGHQRSHAQTVLLDANNIPYVPPLNPFMTPSTALLFNEPKLSPVLGTLTSHHATANPNTSSSSSAGDSSFNRVVFSASQRNPIPPQDASPHKRPLVVSGKDKENVMPSSLHSPHPPTPIFHEQSNPMPF